jgi:hypothetical protein
MSLQHVVGLSFGSERRRNIWGAFVSSSDLLGGLRVPADWIGCPFREQSDEAEIA